MAALDRAEGGLQGFGDLDQRIGVSVWFRVGDGYAEGGDGRGDDGAGIGGATVCGLRDTDLVVDVGVSRRECW